MAFKVITVFCFLALTKASVIENVAPTAITYSSFSTPVVTKTVIGPIKKTIISPTEPAPVHYETVISTEESKFRTLDGAEHSKFSKSVDTAYSANQFNTHEINGRLSTHEIPTLYAKHAGPIYYHQGYHTDNPVVHVVPSQAKSAFIPISYSAPLSKTIVTSSGPIASYLPYDNSKTYLTNVITPSTSYVSPLTKSDNIYNTIKQSQPIKYDSYDSYLAAVDKAKYSSQVTKNVPFATYGPPALENVSKHVSHGPVVVSKSATTYSEAPVVSHLSFSGLGTNYGW